MLECINFLAATKWLWTPLNRDSWRARHNSVQCNRFYCSCSKARANSVLEYHGVIVWPSAFGTNRHFSSGKEFWFWLSNLYRVSLRWPTWHILIHRLIQCCKMTSTKDPSRWCRSTGTHLTHQKGLYIDLYVLCVSYVSFHIILPTYTSHTFVDCPTIPWLPRSWNTSATKSTGQGHLLGGLLGAWAVPHMAQIQNTRTKTQTDPSQLQIRLVPNWFAKEINFWHKKPFFWEEGGGTFGEKSATWQLQKWFLSFMPPENISASLDVNDSPKRFLVRIWHMLRYKLKTLYMYTTKYNYVTCNVCIHLRYDMYIYIYLPAEVIRLRPNSSSKFTQKALYQKTWRFRKCGTNPLAVDRSRLNSLGRIASRHCHWVHCHSRDILPVKHLFF